MATKKKQKDEAVLNGALVVSVILAAYFLVQLLQLLQNVKTNGILGAPSTYAGLPSGLLALYVFSQSVRLSKRYAAVIVLTVLLTGVLVWLFGATSAGSSLVNHVTANHY